MIKLVLHIKFNLIYLIQLNSFILFYFKTNKMN
jgi:hypothetical protein